MVADEQGEQVGWPGGEQLVEEASGAVPVARGPCLEDSAVDCLAVVEGEQVKLSGELAGPFQVDRIGRRERHVGGQYEAHDEIGVVVNERGHRVEELVSVGEEVVDGCVVTVDRRLFAGDGVAVGVGACGE